MYKKSIILLFVFVLCFGVPISYAQDYKKAADYLRGRYVQRLMERKYGTSSTVFNDINKINSPITIEGIKEINKKMHAEKTDTDQSYQLINEKIDSLFDYDDSVLVALLVYHDTIPLMVGKTVSLYQWVTDVKSGPKSLDLESLKAEIKPLLQNKSRTNKTKHYDSTPIRDVSSPIRVGVSVIWLFVVAILSVLLTFLITRRYYADYYHKKIADEKRNRMKAEEVIGKLNMDITNLKSQLNCLQHEQVKPTPPLGVSGTEPIQNQHRTAPSDRTAAKLDNNNGFLYAESILNGYLVRVSSEHKSDNIYRIRTNGSLEATFDIVPHAFPKILANSSFLDGCVVQVLNNPSTVEIISVGKARYESDSGRWFITQKLSVRLK